MPIKTDELLDAAEILAKERNFRVTVKYSLAGGALTGLTTLAGGITLGPIGLAIGGLFGGFTSYFATRGTFKPLYEVIANDLTPMQKQQLVNHLREALIDFDVTDVVSVTTLVLTSSSLQNTLAGALISYFREEMKMTIIQ